MMIIPNQFMFYLNKILDSIIEWVVHHLTKNIYLNIKSLQLINLSEKDKLQPNNYLNHQKRNLL